MKNLPTFVFLAATGLAAAGAAHAAPARSVEARETVVFAQGGVALDAANRARIIEALHDAATRPPCQPVLGVSGYGDRGMRPATMRLLALERAKYLRDLVARAQPGLPQAGIHIGNGLAADAAYEGTGYVELSGIGRAAGCGPK